MKTLSQAFDDSHRYDVAEYRRQVYLGNGWKKLQRWDGRGNLLEAGIAGPSTVAGSWAPTPVTAGGNTTPGVHRFRYRYQDSRTGYVSNPSAEVDLTVAAPLQQLSFPIANAPGTPGDVIRSTDPKVDRIVLEATTAGGVVFYQVAVVDQADSAVTCDISDDALAVKFLPYADDGHDQPPVAKWIASHRERLWLFGSVAHSRGTISVTMGSTNVNGNGTKWSSDALGAVAGGSSGTWLLLVDGDEVAYEVDFVSSEENLNLLENYGGATRSAVGYTLYRRANAVWISNAGNPEGFRPLDFLPGPSGERAGDLTGGIGFGPVMLFSTETGLFKFSWDLDPTSDGQWSPVSSTRGAVSKRVMVEVEGTIYGMDRSGWWSWAGVFPTQLSDPVDELLLELDFDRSETWHAAWYPKLRAIRWYVTKAGDAYPKDYVQLDIDSGSWSTGTSSVGISESRLVLTAEGLKTYLGDEQGRVWEAERGRSDGAPWVRLERLTVADDSSSLVFAVEESLPELEGGLEGFSVYSPRLNAAATIRSNTRYTVELTSALELREGEVLWLGRIDARLKTRAFLAGMFSRVEKYRYLHLSFEPARAPGRALVRIYENLSSEERTDYGRPREALDGLSEPGRKDDRVGELSDAYAVKVEKDDGYVRLPFGSKFVRQLEIEIEAGEPGLQLLLVGLGMDGQRVERAAD